MLLTERLLRSWVYGERERRFLQGGLAWLAWGRGQLCLRPATQGLVTLHEKAV